MNKIIPDVARCLELMETFSMWENIRCHSFMVARVAEFLHRQLDNAGRAGAVPQRELVIAGALLHDIAKSKCLDEGCRHADVGAVLCEELGYMDIAEIVANHVILSDFEPNRYQRGEFNAVELVFYADKRVKHDQVVSLDERLDYILEKYANNSQRNEALIIKNFAACRTLEKHLFARLDFSPADIPNLLAEESAGTLQYPPLEPVASAQPSL
ncbi:HD domain-containing protein [Desulfopila aestuarii]|uniref:HDIG domain-containing protein n=1 Tax=Desulfopila aestuarii DSM 18488 TaxID=1121416 RepID=A0A1M7Y896_9BACT|nr:HD domain-containing protein [Desulfopila aestuarii]SHO48776.1 HDIG domain-containing protein [Desulfopila aestuarii DSM 18488]